ncbi:MAG: zinc ribbon domain-containing protein [Lachnospiraceae bacterium]|nr:zinc ribbon domain-containing protein [Lachnospiraceae bacterium]
MFWTKVTKIYLRVQAVLGVIGSLLLAITVDNPWVSGIPIFISGVIATLIFCCLLGTFVEISEAVNNLSAKVVGQTAAERELQRRLDSIENGMDKMLINAKNQGAAAVKKTAQKIAESIPEKQMHDIDKPISYPKEDLDETVAYKNDIKTPVEDDDKTTVLPMDVIMEKVNGTKPDKKPEVAGRFCPTCGAKNNEGSAFCFSCGSKL